MEHAFAIGFDAKRIGIKSRMVNIEGLNLEWSNPERPARRKCLCLRNAFGYTLALLIHIADIAHIKFGYFTAKFTHIDGYIIGYDIYFTDMIAMIMG